MAVVASVAVLFEAIPLLRGGVGNVAYFFLWIAALSVVGLRAGAWSGNNDLMGVDLVIPGILSACGAAFPGCATSKEFSMGFNLGSKAVLNLTTFRWEGVHWTPEIVIGRSMWVVLALGMAFLASAFFHRFDPARQGRKGATPSPAESSEPEVSPLRPATLAITLGRLAPASRRFRFGGMVMAELRLALKGLSWLWYAVAGGLIIGGLVSPVAVSRGLLIAAWIWPILIWSAMGTRESRLGTDQVVFSTAHPLRRQLTACWVAGVVVAVMTGSGTAARLLVARDRAGLAAWTVGALFIPALALALGVWSGSSKLFEVVYTLLWYIGPVNRVAELDYTGAASATSGLSTRWVFLAVTLALVALSFAGRKRQLQD
jgi:hypothetical protein